MSTSTWGRAKVAEQDHDHDACGSGPAVPVEQHLDLLLRLGRDAVAARGPVAAEHVSLADAPGRVLAGEVAAVVAVPPFTASAMDGFAVRTSDVDLLPDGALELVVAGDLPAGSGPAVLPPGTAMRIMTGAALPAGADAVVPVECTDHRAGAGPAPARVRLDVRPGAWAHVRPAAEDARVGDVVLPAGERVTPAHVAAAASVGHATLAVVPRPRVLVVATGDELAEPGTPPGPGEVPDSGGPLLAALVAQAGGIPTLARCADDVSALRALLAGAHADLVLTAGGVSQGAYEVVREALGDDLVLEDVAMQPGRPQGAGAVEVGGRAVPLVALPGNPVSSFVGFHVLVRPLLALLAGTEAPTRTLPVVAGRAWRARAGRRQYTPVALRRTGDELVAEPPHPLGAGSHLVASLARAEALAIVPAEVDGVRAGDRLEALPVRDWTA
ncbi:gephyrin-like molybdotransferase Glp [Georgenia sp. Z1344]|uniref:molybdopterin molybdotransferase MoeA n=1 Tax=Georgenia sp. Z1344 TaxID=3416706 RepID=UPI003CEE8AA8